MKIDKTYKERKKMAENLNKATKEYDKGEPIISDKEWDDLYFKLLALEESAGTAFTDSPTQTISYEVVNELEKIEHEHPMLSLPKTKSINELENFIGDYDYIVMSKLDGLTCSLTYENGELIRAETRGDGKIGENILHNAKVINNIPNFIDYKERLVVDGEVICKYNNFEEFSSDYKNPRNFAAGSIRLLNSEECEKRNLSFIVWDIIEGFEEEDYLHNRLEKAYKLGFTCVDYTAFWSSIEEDIDFIKTQAKKHFYPIDGVVIKYESKKLRDSLPITSHHLGGAIAYKFYDEEYSTRLKNIEWSLGRTGILTPVAVFAPIDIDGSTVERASLHNLTIMKETLGTLYPSVGDIVYVYKSNEIIPQISRLEKNDDNLNTNINLPTACPVCDKELEKIKSDISDTENLVCTNPNCPGKLINQLDHYCGKKGLDIKGLSKKTLEKLIDWNWINNLEDIYLLKEHRDEWIKKSGFGLVSVNKILNSIFENSQNIKLEDFISALGIPLIGKSVSQELVKHIKTWDDFINKVENKFDFSEYDNIGINKLEYIYNFDYTIAKNIIKKEYITFAELVPTENQIDSPQSLQEKNICITGKLQTYKNRDELIKDIIDHGGKVTNSVSKNTNYLINNNINSTSSKNLKAKELNIPILTEDEFKQKYLT